MVAVCSLYSTAINKYWGPEYDDWEQANSMSLQMKEKIYKQTLNV